MYKINLKNKNKLNKKKIKKEIIIKIKKLSNEF